MAPSALRAAAAWGRGSSAARRVAASAGFAREANDLVVGGAADQLRAHRVAPAQRLAQLACHAAALVQVDPLADQRDAAAVSAAAAGVGGVVAPPPPPTFPGPGGAGRGPYWPGDSAPGRRPLPAPH